MSYANLIANARGPLTLDVEAVRENATKAHKPDVRLHLRELPGLEQQRGQLAHRIDGRKKDVAALAPVVANLRRLATNALDELTALTEAVADGAVHVDRVTIENKRRDADRAETTWAGESKQLERLEAMLTDAERLLKEFDATYGDRLKRLRQLNK